MTLAAALTDPLVLVGTMIALASLPLSLLAVAVHRLGRSGSWLLLERGYACLWAGELLIVAGIVL